MAKKSVTIETEQTVMGYHDCIVLKSQRTKLNARDISEAIEADGRIDSGAYAQLHVKSYGEVDSSLYEDGDEVVLFPLETLMKNIHASQWVELPLRNGHCPVCGFDMANGGNYCPQCGQAIKYQC